MSHDQMSKNVGQTSPLRSQSYMYLPEAAKIIRTFLSQPPMYIRLLYKLINVINRPGRIAWESVFCTETVSILNERERERDQHFFSFCIVLFLILICPLCPLFCRVCWKGLVLSNQHESDRIAELQILLSLAKCSWLNRNWTRIFPQTINQKEKKNIG